MKIANLDNEVHFKNVFTNVDVFAAFVKDILNIDIHITKVETEKVLPSQVSPIKFRMDLFAEDEEQRTVVEIQKVDYDYTYDRFSHYFFANLVDLQKSSRAYSFDKDVYVIVVVTSAYKINDKNNQAIKDDVLITDTNPRTLNGEVHYMHNHKLVILNTINTTDNTPAAIKDWLDLISESMKTNQDISKINQRKKGIAKAVQLAELNDLTPDQLAEAKELEMRKIAIAMREDTSKREVRDNGILNLLALNKLTYDEIANSFDVTIEYVKTVEQQAKK